MSEIDRRKMIQLAFGAAATTIAFDSTKSAQSAEPVTAGGAGRKRSGKSFKCRFWNKTGKPIIAGCFGIFEGQSWRSETIQDGKYFDTPPGEYIEEGYRVAVAWDDFRESVIVTQEVHVDEKTEIFFEVATVTSKKSPGI